MQDASLQYKNYFYGVVFVALAFYHCPSLCYFPKSQMAPIRTQGNRKWWREHFKDHPKLKSKVSPDAAEALATGKPKIMCLRHLDYEIGMIQEADRIDVDAGLRVAVRDVDQIEAECKYQAIHSNNIQFGRNQLRKMAQEVGFKGRHQPLSTIYNSVCIKQKPLRIL